MEILKIIVEFNTFYSFLLIAFGFSLKKLSEKYKIFILRKLLSIYSRECKLTASVANVDFFNKKYNMISIEEFSSLYEIIALLDKIDIKYHIFNAEEKTYIDEIHIGGPIANLNVNSLFTEYFPSFKVFLKGYYKWEYTQALNQCLLVENASFAGYEYLSQNQKKYLERKEEIDYVFLIKMTNEDFNYTQKKSVHIMFGGDVESTEAITHYFIHNYKQLYKEFRNRHYFICFPINRLDRTLILSKRIDLTNDMFK